MLWRIILALTVGALAYAVTAPPARPRRRQRTPRTEENEKMSDEKEYEVLRDHGAKPGGEVGPAFRKGDTRELRPEVAKALVNTGVLKAQAVEKVGEKAEPAPANKAEARPANKGATISSEELVKRGPGRPRTNPPAVDDDDDEE